MHALHRPTCSQYSDGHSCVLQGSKYAGVSPWLATQLSVDGRTTSTSTTEVQETVRYRTPPPQLRVHVDHGELDHVPVGSSEDDGNGGGDGDGDGDGDPSTTGLNGDDEADNDKLDERGGGVGVNDSDADELAAADDDSEVAPNPDAGGTEALVDGVTVSVVDTVAVIDSVGDGDEHIVLPDDENCPTPQLPEQFAVASLLVAPYRPALQFVHVPLPASEYWPAGHANAIALVDPAGHA